MNFVYFTYEKRKKEKNMTKTAIALAAVLVLGTASAALTEERDIPGGARVGPLGNSATQGVNPAVHRSLRGAGAFALAPGDDTLAYCMQRFKSFDPATGTYMGLDGMRHSCP
jgi:hypothetical protein